jgi:hypothetical protein
MADVYVSGLVVALRSKWTPELKQQVGESVLNALFQRIQENRGLPEVDLKNMSASEFLEYMGKDNTPNNATIKVNSN